MPLERVGAGLAVRWRAKQVLGALRRAQEALGLRPFVVLKGEALVAQLGYVLGERLHGDVDVLVERGDLPGYARGLAPLGYRLPAEPWDLVLEADRTHHAQICAGGPVLVELHTSLFMELPPWHLDEVLERSLPLVVAGVPTRVPDPVDHFIFSCHHLGAEVVLGPVALAKGMRDLDRFTRAWPGGGEVPWDAIAKRVEAWGNAGIVTAALAFTARHLGAGIPLGAQRVLGRLLRPWERRLVTAIGSPSENQPRAVGPRLRYGRTLGAKVRLDFSPGWMPLRRIVTLAWYRVRKRLREGGPNL